MRPKLFRDPIHDIITFELDDPIDRVLFELVCTSTFQRLRRIRQLGFASLVYHGAEHSRFAHSLGVVHIARRMLKALNGSIDDDTRMEVLGAALLHDIGHGPFSHAIEKVTGAHHETFTQRAVLDEDGEIYPILEDYSAGMADRIARYFGPRQDFPADRQLLLDIVSSQLDADRQDYILRDGHATGVKIGMYDFERILAMLTTYENIDDDSGERVTRLAVSYRAREAVEGYLIARFHMFKQVYLHKTVRSAEKMLEAALRRGAELLASGVRWSGLPADPPLLKLLSGTPISTAEYLDIDDTDVWMMLKAWQNADDDSLARLSLGLLQRRLYKTIDLDRRDPVLVARVIDRANEIAAEQGLDPNYAVLVDRASDTPYTPYDPSHPRLSAHIPVVERSGRVVPIEDGSDIVHLLGRDSYNTIRLCVPTQVRDALLETFPAYAGSA